MKKEYKAHNESLNSNRKLINAIKKAGIETYHPEGRWNGYGYERLPLVAKIKSLGEQRKFNKIKKEIIAYQEEHPKKEKTMEEVIETWAKRLVKLYNPTVEDDEKLTLEEAKEIAWEKLKYQNEQINKMIERQYERGYSIRREKLIDKMERANPLRYIKDAEHACRIVEAHNRHTSGYDRDLAEAHELEDSGEIEKGTARVEARKMYYGDVDYSKYN